MMSATALLALLCGLRVAFAQSFTVTSFSESVGPVFPTGDAQGPSQIESTIPLACTPGCQDVTQPYYACYINTTLLDGSTIPPDFCDDFFCSEGNYTQLVDCANCIIANGDERPFGYHTNTELTAAPTERYRPLGLPINPLGLINEEQANGWLRNVTERCSSINRPVTGASSVTATPTTTGPYYTSFESGQAKTLPTWTGLTQYPPPMLTVRRPVEQVTASDSNSNSDSGNGSPTSSTPASSSSSSDAINAGTQTKGSAGLAILGLILAYVVGV